ncbi:hypothetical protein ACOSQ4_010488 [Xanthoceras sorbifolium]
MCEFNATVTFLGQRHEIGTFLRDYISLQMLWESTMRVTLKRKPAVGKRLIQHVPIPWSGENRAIHSDSDLMDVLAEFEAKKGPHEGIIMCAVALDANCGVYPVALAVYEHLWPDVEFATVLPPLKRRRPGRPKLQRRRGLNEPKKVPRSSSLKCSICHEGGHNSRTCKKKNDGQFGGNQGTTSSSAPLTSTVTNRRRMEVSFFLFYLRPTNRNAETDIF